MLVALSRLLLTSCLVPIHDENAWGTLLPVYDNQQQLACDPIQGLRVAKGDTAGPMLQSTKTLGNWSKAAPDVDAASAITSSNIAMEVWMTLPPAKDDSADDEQETILTIGGPAVSPSTYHDQGGNINDDDDYCNPNTDVELSIYQRHLLLRFRSSNENSPSTCSTLYVSSVDLEPRQLTQFVVVWSSSSESTTANNNSQQLYLSIYMNGAAIYEHVLVNAASAATWAEIWKPSSVLWLFGNPMHQQPFRGSLAQVTMYSGNDSNQQHSAWVNELYQTGVVRTDPLVLQAAPARVVALDQGSVEPVEIAIATRNVSQSWFRISAELLTVPMHGTLQGPQGLLAVGDTLAFPISEGAVNSTDALQLQLKYTLDSLAVDYFNTPNTEAYGNNLQMAPESFSYRLVAHDAVGRELAISPTVRQFISIVHVNHKPALIGPTAVDAGSYKSNSNTAIITGILLHDNDYNIDRVRVDVWADAGYLTLAANTVELADFDSCRGRTYSPWQCMGDGLRNRNMTFIAIPNDVNAILNHMTYEAMTTDTADEIVIRVSDGEGEACLSADEQMKYTDEFGRPVTSRRRECFQVEWRISVPPIQFDSGQDSSTSTRGFFGTRLNTARLIFWLLVFGFMICFGCCLRRCPRYLARGGKVHVDGDDDESVDQEGGHARQASF
ncbi:hypothetical protein MPSEU_000361400 [Mayamaea pseudoterrestris]|nr:hypothetical protein MPSEU_000361400 [Mayamaea pseudoterrestris]